MIPNENYLDFTAESEADDDYDDRYITLSKYILIQLNSFDSCGALGSKQGLGSFAARP